jgi:D-alanyl-lipoteichoic acid acyltransferase DltB (MBOAT superfamily)
MHGEHKVKFREHFSLSVQLSITVLFKLFSHTPLSQAKHVHVPLSQTQHVCVPLGI